MKTSEERTAKALRKVGRRLDSIGLTPLRHIIDSCVCFSLNAIDQINVDRCLVDEEYYQKISNLSSAVNDFLDFEKFDNLNNDQK